VKVSEFLNQMSYLSKHTTLSFTDASNANNSVNVVGVDWDDDDFYLIPEGWLKCFKDAFEINNLESLMKIVDSNPHVMELNLFARIDNKWTEEGTAISSNSAVVGTRELINDVICAIHSEEASTLTFKGARDIKYVQSPETE